MTRTAVLRAVYCAVTMLAVILLWPRNLLGSAHSVTVSVRAVDWRNPPAVLGGTLEPFDATLIRYPSAAAGVDGLLRVIDIVQLLAALVAVVAMYRFSTAALGGEPFGQRARRCLGVAVSSILLALVVVSLLSQALGRHVLATAGLSSTAQAVATTPHNLINLFVVLMWVAVWTLMAEGVALQRERLALSED